MPKASEVSVPKENTINNIDAEMIEINVILNEGASLHTIRNCAKVDGAPKLTKS